MIIETKFDIGQQVAEDQMGYTGYVTEISFDLDESDAKPSIVYTVFHPLSVKNERSWTGTYSEGSLRALPSKGE